MKLERAYSLITIKAIDDDKRVIEGIASTPTVDHMGDIVEPKGAEYTLPIPLLWHHSHDQPIGTIDQLKVTKEGITIRAKLAKIEEPGRLKDRLDEAWHSIKTGLVRGLSIGFKSLESQRIDDTFGVRFVRWLLLEVSAVTIPANADASIQSIKSFDSTQRAASGQTQGSVRLIQSPGASGQPAAKSGSVKLILRKYT